MQVEKRLPSRMIVAIVLLIVSFIFVITWVFWKSIGLIFLPFTIGFIGTLSSFIISFTTFLNVRKAGATSTRLYKVAKDVMIISLIMLVLITPFEIMVLKYTISPPVMGNILPG